MHLIALPAFAFVLSVLASTSVAAQDVPRYDPESYCQEVAETVGGSAMIFNGCIQQEQMHYDGMKAAWSTIPAATINYCDDVARVIGGSYAILAGCIQQELAAQNSTPQFQF